MSYRSMFARGIVFEAVLARILLGHQVNSIYLYTFSENLCLLYRLALRPLSLLACLALLLGSLASFFRVLSS